MLCATPHMKNESLPPCIDDCEIRRRRMRSGFESHPSMPLTREALGLRMLQTIHYDPPFPSLLAWKLSSAQQQAKSYADAQSRSDELNSVSPMQTTETRVIQAIQKCEYTEKKKQSAHCPTASLHSVDLRKKYPQRTPSSSRVASPLRAPGVRAKLRRTSFGGLRRHSGSGVISNSSVTTQKTARRAGLLCTANLTG